MTVDRFEKRKNAQLTRAQREIDAIFKVAAQEAAAIAGTVRKPNPDKVFSFNDYPQTHARIAKLEEWMAEEIERTISNNITEEWNIAEASGEQLTTDFLQQTYQDVSSAPAALKARYYRNNTEAHDAFLARTIKGMGLSDRVWRLTAQCRQEMELAIDIGLGDGLSAQKISQSIRQYLKEPDKLFRRVRDKHGNLVLSKAAKAYHPGQGVYRSSYKNALRLSATEGNIAYRTADHLKWQQLDFVVGIQIGLSNNHTLNGVPFHDICDELAGRYPKDFKFTGWHPFCRCIATTILMTPEEFKANEEAFLDGKEPTVRSKNEVDDVPPQFKKWRKEHAKQIKTAKSLPYFVRDNEQYFNPTKITKRAAKGVKESQALNKALSQATDPAVLRAELRNGAFVPAQSIKEVESRLHKSGIASIELGNITLAEANIALEAIEVEARGHKLDLAKFRIADDVYEGVRNRATNNIGGIFNEEKRTLSLNTSIFRQSIYRKPLSWDERIGALEGKIAKNKAEIEKYEGYLGKNKKMDKELKAHISQLKQQNLGFEKQIYEFGKLRDAGTPSYTLLVAEQFESIREQVQAQIHHEFGHYVDARLGRPSSKGIKASISEYGSKMDSESFAEWYAHYRMKGAEGVPADLLKIFEEYDGNRADWRRNIVVKESRKEYLEREGIHKFFDEDSGGYIVVDKQRLYKGNLNKQEKAKFDKEYGMCEVLAKQGHKIELVEEPSTKAFYDIMLDGKPAELKKLSSHNNIVKEAKKAIKNKGADVVVFEFNRSTELIQRELSVLKRQGIDVLFYFEDTPEKIHKL